MSVQGPGSGAHKHFTATYGTAYDSKSSEVEDKFQIKASVIYLMLLLGESAGGPAGVRLLLPPGDHLPLLHLVLLHGQYTIEIQTKAIRSFAITEKAPTFKTLLRLYGKQALTPR